MKSFGNKIYGHRRKIITKYHKGNGWYIENDLNIYATLDDCKQAINKRLDGDNIREPKIIGQWEE